MRKFIPLNVFVAAAKCFILSFRVETGVPMIAPSLRGVDWFDDSDGATIYFSPKPCFALSATALSNIIFPIFQRTRINVDAERLPSSPKLPADNKHLPPAKR